MNQRSKEILFNSFKKRVNTLPSIKVVDVDYLNEYHTLIGKRQLDRELFFKIVRVGIDTYIKRIEHSMSKDHSTTAWQRYNKLIDNWIWRVFNEYDNIVLFGGAKGDGKSGSACQIALEFVKKINPMLQKKGLQGIEFNRRTHIIYTLKQLKNAIDTLPLYSVLVCDEAIQWILAKEWAKAQNKEMSRFMGQLRTKYFTMILCFPLPMIKVEAAYRDSYITQWIMICEKGKAVEWGRGANPAGEAWNMKEFGKMVAMDDKWTFHRKLREYKKHPNYKDFLYLKKYPDKEYEKYKAWRDENVYDDGSLKDDKGDSEATKPLSKTPAYLRLTLDIYEYISVCKDYFENDNKRNKKDFANWRLENKSISKQTTSKQFIELTDKITDTALK